MRWFFLFLAGVMIAIASFFLHPLEAQSAAGCDPSYPGICIAPPPPDLDCKDISYRNFTVLQPDPHHFDGDRDGIGCERRK
ncbi:calcium-binding protein with excalibur domain protein [Kovacikia minuta CCNUW1]|uniref:calcium-binding protein with excalibur domain protein n=1 Tax=Kovacikia minuta TaxID=2931930 RepID=UPI001CCC358A|nr:calcium-binding protein with excalibur domain protein [Kovacikia minuta]UBF29159.1 calcium-binding protein with excalibur domain protein [Kovacikia minuta CCNUW1]